MPTEKAQSSTGNRHRSVAGMTGNARRGVDKDGSNWHWTNERHVRFLNSMEASFVESMFGGWNGGRGSAAAPPLDRFLPDTAESTQDLAKERWTRQHTATSASGSSGRTDKNKTFTCQKSSQDQVVPQLDKGDDKDEMMSPLGQPIKKEII